MTNKPPSGAFPTGFNPATASICSGCDVTWNGSGLSNGTTTGRAWGGSDPLTNGNWSISGYGIGGYARPGSSQSVLNGIPNGTLTGGFPNPWPLGQVRVIYNRALDGICGPQTGVILYSGTSGTGVLVYRPETGCTGFSGCRTDLQIWFEPGQSFLLSAGYMFVNSLDYCNGRTSGLFFRFPFYDTSGNPLSGSFPPGYVPSIGWKLYDGRASQQACGQYCSYEVQAVYNPVFASGLGTLIGATGWTLGCTPCTGS
jgi:hypothetical protein